MDWDSEFAWRSPMSEPLRAHASAFGADWPGLPDLQRLLDLRDPPVCNACGTPLRLVAPARGSRNPEEKYEARTYLRGELQVRDRNWHDLLNVLVWRLFPRAKAALNARHYAELLQQRTANRGPAQDALTLFDEGGVVVASADDELAGYLQAWRWKELFWRSRARLESGMRFYLFGHALYEKALQPFGGITGRGIVLRIEPELLAAPLGEQIAALDTRLAAHLSDPAHLSGTRELAVVPILGVPGWSPDNGREAYYDDPDYFRPLDKRRDGCPKKGR
jgi:hypothetical protein